MPRRKEITVPEDKDLEQKPSFEQTQWALRRFVENFYDIQERRLQVELRTTPKAKGSEIVLFEADQIRLERATSSLKSAEADALRDVNNALKRIPFYVNILSDKIKYRGIGPTMAGVILSSFNIQRADTVSKMWAFAGLAPEPCHRCRYCHVIVEPLKSRGGNTRSAYGHVKQWQGQVLPKCTAPMMTNDKEDWIEEKHVYESHKSMKPKKGEKLKYSKWLRAKLCGVLGGVLLKCDSPWRKFYDDYKNRKEQSNWGLSKMHRHRAAIRYMIKMMLKQIYIDWRTFEGLPVREPYEVEYLGRKHHEATTTSTQPASAKIEPTQEDFDNARIDEEVALALG